MLLHRLQQRGLRFGRRPVDLVGQQHLRKDRPSFKDHFAASGFGVFLDDLRARDIAGHQVGRELNPPKRQVHRLGQRANHQRLGQPGHAFQQAMSPRQDRDQQLFDDRILADNDLRDLFTYFFTGFDQLSGRLRIIFRFDGWRLNQSKPQRKGCRKRPRGRSSLTSRAANSRDFRGLKSQDAGAPKFPGLK